MKIGLATTDFEPECGPLPLNVLFEKVQSFGFDCLQLSFSSVSEARFLSDGNFDIPPDISDELVEEISAAARQYNLSVTAINGTYNIAHPDPDVRAEGLRRFALIARAAQRLGTPVVTLCSGSRCKDDMWTPHPENESMPAFTDMLDSMKELVQIADQYDLLLAIEPEASNIIDSPEKARAVMDLAGPKRLRMIMDPANLFHTGKAKRTNVRPILDHAVATFGKSIALAHGKDIREGPGIEFCPAGEGIVDFSYMKELLDHCGYSGELIVHGVYDQSKMAAICDKMRAIFS